MISIEEHKIYSKTFQVFLGRIQQQVVEKGAKYKKDYKNLEEYHITKSMQKVFQELCYLLQKDYPEERLDGIYSFEQMELRRE